MLTQENVYEFKETIGLIWFKVVKFNYKYKFRNYQTPYGAFSDFVLVIDCNIEAHKLRLSMI